jgi:hypothetical protein
VQLNPNKVNIKQLNNKYAGLHCSTFHTYEYMAAYAHLLTCSKSERRKSIHNINILVIIPYRTDLDSAATIRLYNLPRCCDRKENTAKRFENATL